VTATLLLLPLLAAAEPLMVPVAPDARIAVYDSGPADGPAVVLVPGLSGCAYGFRKLEPLLHDQGRRTIVIEPLGLGLSDRTNGADYSLTAQAERLAAALDARGARGALVVGQGVSASMVFRLALARPDRVAGILSIEGGPAEAAGTPKVRSTLKLAKLVAHLGGGSLLRDRFAEDLKKASGDDSWVDRRTIGYYFRGPNRDLQGTLDAFLAMADGPDPVPLIPRLDRVAVPVTVLEGGAEHEGDLTPDQQAVLREKLPDVRFVTVPGAGHFIYEEQPDAVAAAVDSLAARMAASRP